MHSPPLHIVLLHPEIPTNTGNIGRTVAVTGCCLHIVRPIAFDLSEKARRRAGLDYWHILDWKEHASWEAFCESECPARLWLLSTRGERPHWDVRYREGDYLLFGNETGGIPDTMHDEIRQRWGSDCRLRLPMITAPGARSLNLATAVSVAVYEGLRQVGLPSLSPSSGNC